MKISICNSNQQQQHLEKRKKSKHKKKKQYLKLLCNPKVLKLLLEMALTIYKAVRLLYSFLTVFKIVKFFLELGRG